MAAGPGAHGVGQDVSGEHGHRPGDLDEPSGGRVGNMRGLDDNEDGPGRSEEMRPEERLQQERIGNIRDLGDDDTTRRDDATLRDDGVTRDDPLTRDDGLTRDDDLTTGDRLDADRTRTHTGPAGTTDDPDLDETTGEKRSVLDRARDKVDDALGRRDTDGDGRRG